MPLANPPKYALTKTRRRRTSAIDKRTSRHVGYRISQSCRAMVECAFGWGKQHGTMRKTKHCGIVAVGAGSMLNLIAYNLVRIPKLIRRLSPDAGSKHPSVPAKLIKPDTRRISRWQRIAQKPRPVVPPSTGTVIAFPEVGGLHHRYERRAA